MTAIITGLLVLLVSACGSEEAADGAEAPPASSATSADTVLVQTDDAELRELARGILPELARRSGLELREPVRIARRSRAELVDYLTFKLDEDLPPERAEAVTTTYRLLGLVPEDFDLREILLAVYTEQVAGFYDPDSVALFVMDDQPAGSLQTVLVHELVHAVQDQATDLDSLTAPERGNDRQVAAQAAIEGHATVVMLEQLMEEASGEAVDLSEIPDFTRQVRPALENLRGQYPALAGAPRVIQEALLFPYLEGAGYVQALWRARQGRPAPFGPHLPGSTEQVLEATRSAEDAFRDVPTEVTFRGDAFGDVVYDNGMGAMEVRILLEEVGGADLSGVDVGWDGDRYALFQDPDGAPSLTWFSVWDSTADRDAFVERLRPGLESLPRRASLEPVEVEGRAGALLRIGDPPTLTVLLSEDG